MTALVETGTAGRAVQLDHRELHERNARTPDLDVLDAWFWTPAVGDLPFTVTVFVVPDDGEEELPGTGRYMAAILAGNKDTVSYAIGRGLTPADGLAVVGAIRLPDLITTDDGARRVVRALMREAAAGTIPANPTGRDAGMAWTKALGRACVPFGSTIRVERA